MVITALACLHHGSKAFMQSTFSARASSSLRSSLRMSAEGNKFDYLVIGGGSGGIASARRAATYGAKVAVIEKQALGGTCVNVGCVPKKVMYNTASIAEAIHAAGNFGFDGVSGTLDWAKLKKSRDAYIERLNGIYMNNLKNSGVELITGTGKFVGPKEVQVGETTYTADNILIAVGGVPIMPSVPGAEHCISSDGFFALEEMPKKVAVFGAGYIAVELAGIFHALGVDTTLYVRGNRPLRAFDDMVAYALKDEMARSGLKLETGSILSAIVKEEAEEGSEAGSGPLTVELEDGRREEGFDCIIQAVGRKPLTEPLGLDAAQVELNGGGYILVDSKQATSTEGVFAVGDNCAGAPQLTPTAIAAGRRLADRLFGGYPQAEADFENTPTVIFSHPPIGTIGLTEEQAREKYGEDELKVYTSTFANLYYGTWPMNFADKPKTAMKLICQGPDEKVVGLHIIGMGADEMLQGFGVAMKMGCTKADLDSCIAIHPTAAEELVTLAPWGLSPASTRKLG
eukprot:CAMPEP_0113943548 /NCGR_PEP_ID=MMETSP1339-20121228/25961_1 /TAXON_ID=94617 /ORGANISM="Fibrocapsa japonica" /LENGTH=513 /DNA_ID=CAMNT_0000948451 /DNA_START=144 /DNA_END=1685 /DNA_ORIENTATION=- /assembly_acc=CAM_ASM_000762